MTTHKTKTSFEHTVGNGEREKEKELTLCIPYLSLAGLRASTQLTQSLELAIGSYLRVSEFAARLLQGYFIRLSLYLFTSFASCIEHSYCPV